MADMAPMDSVDFAWKNLILRKDLNNRKIIPITYMNSHAPLKAFTGKFGGAVCTSSNAHKVMQWAWERGEILFFFPDQHLGRNTAKTMGLLEEEMKIWYPSKENGGIESLENVKLILWNGHCPVHMKFTARDVRFVRKNFPQAKVIVHPECEKEVVDLADASGSTEFISQYVRNLAPRTQVFIATEVHLVERLKKELPHLRIEFLTRSLCPTMYMVDLNKLERTLTNIDTEEKVPMPLEIKQDAKLALERMLSLS
jgi:quinolinate synthase